MCWTMHRTWAQPVSSRPMRWPTRMGEPHARPEDMATALAALSKINEAV